MPSPRTFVTGVAGFTGRHLIERLQARGHEVTGLVQSERELLHPMGVRLYQGNLADGRRLLAVLDEVRPDFVVHLAAQSFVAHEDVESIYQTNLLGTRSLLDALARYGHVKHVLLVSSANVYGNSTADPIDETVAAQPTNDYAVSKLAMEYLARTWADRVPFTLVRPFNYTGVGQARHFLIPKMVNAFAQRAPELELGNLDVVRDFSDVRDVVETYGRLLELPGQGHTYNVCSGQGHSLMDILGMLQRLSGFRPEVRVNPAFVRANEVHRLVGDPTKLERALGRLERKPLESTVSWMLQALGGPAGGG